MGCKMCKIESREEMERTECEMTNMPATDIFESRDEAEGIESEIMDTFVRDTSLGVPQMDNLTCKILTPAGEQYRQSNIDSRLRIWTLFREDNAYQAYLVTEKLKKDRHLLGIKHFLEGLGLTVRILYTLELESIPCINILAIGTEEPVIWIPDLIDNRPLMNFIFDQFEIRTFAGDALILIKRTGPPAPPATPSSSVSSLETEF